MADTQPTTPAAPVNPDAYMFSVTKAAAKQQKFILNIAIDSRPGEPTVVPIRNGDLQYNVIRGRNWIVPEAIVAVLRDAWGQAVDSEGRTVAGKVFAYPFQATPYNGKLPLKTEVDEMGEAKRLEEPEYN